MSGRPLTLFWRVFLTITIFSLTLILAGNTLVRLQSERQLQRTELANMQRDGQNLARWAARHLAAGETSGAIVGDLPYISPLTTQRLWLLDRQGQVLFDAHQGSGWVGQRPPGGDLDRILAGSEVACACPDPWLHAGSHVAVPILRPGAQEVLGAVVLFSEAERVTALRSAFLNAMGVSGFVRFLLALALALWLSRALVRPLERLVTFARQLGRGEWDQRLEPAGPLETRQLAESLNQTAGELQAMFRAREVERQRLEAIVTEMAEGVLATDGNGQLVLVNQAARTLLGLPATGAVATGVLPAPLAAALAAAEMAAQSQQGAHQRINLTRGSLDLVALINTLQAGASLGSVAVLQDLTQERRLMRMRENFVANVSHDLRAPLATLGAGMEAIQDGLISPADQPRYRSVMMGEVRRLRRLTDDLLELSRLDAGTLRVDLEPVPLHVVTADLQVGMGPRVQAADLALHVAVPDDLTALVDRDRLEQVLANLVDNAIRFTPPGGRIIIAARAAGEQVEIQVSDTGLGIEPESLPFIFDRFFKVDPARVRKEAMGTGLGLAIVQQLVQAMGGEVTAQSQEGEGSTFTVRLRRVTGEGAPLA